MSVIRAGDAPDPARSEEPIEVISVEGIDGHAEFLPEHSMAAAGHEKGESEGGEEALDLFSTEGSGELECFVEADGSQPSCTEYQPAPHGEEMEPAPGAPARYPTAARAAALLVALCFIVGGMAVTGRLTTPPVPVAQQDEVTGRSVSPLGGDSPVPPERRPQSVDPNAASEVVVSLQATADLPATSTAGGTEIVTEGARDRTRRSEAPEVRASGSRQPASKPVPSLNPVSGRAAARERAEPVPPLLATLPMAPAHRIAELSPPAATPPDIGPADPPSGSIEQQQDVEDGAIRVVLGRYLFASNQLDPAGVLGVWPTADVHALGRAFDQLESHEISLDDCSIVISGAQARADCRGTLSYIPRIGQKHLRVEPRQWRFDLHKVDANWLIAAVAAR